MNNNPVLNQMQVAQSVLNAQMIAQIKGIANNLNSPEMLCRQQGIDTNSFMAQINSAFNGQ